MTPKGQLNNVPETVFTRHDHVDVIVVVICDIWEHGAVLQTYICSPAKKLVLDLRSVQLPE